MTTLKLAPLLAILGLVACESSPSRPTTTFDPTAGGGGSAGDRRGNDGDLAPGEDTVAPPATFDTCATQTASAETRPIYLVFVFDKSGSMIAENSPKWESAKAASKAFFGAQSAGVHASLTFFPDKIDYSCDAPAYATPTVPMTTLPSDAFGKSLDLQIPTGDTPTQAALGGAIQYAQNLAANEAKDGKVAIVIVTDGMPDSTCEGNSVPAVAELASSVAQTLPTYVIGVGSELTSLTQIAEGGGTKSAFIVNTNAPEQIQTDFLAAVNAIKVSAIACDYAIPAAPDGASLDRNRVTVVHRMDTTANTLTYNPACSGGAGWRYDNENAPSRIQLCDASCTTAKTTPGKLEVAFGCADQVRPVR